MGFIGLFFTGTLLLAAVAAVLAVAVVGTVMLWDNVLKLGGIMYSIVPGFVLSIIITVIVLLIDKEPLDEVKAIFEKAKTIE